MMVKKNNIKGMSLLEILVVISVFAILGIIVTQSVILTLRGSRKSESQIRVRENLNYALSVMERQLRNADSITTCTTGKAISYTDSLGNLSTFSCGADYVASAAARLTSSEITVTSCTINCGNIGSSVNPPYVDINLEASDTSAQGVEGAKVTVSSKVYLRTY